MGDILGGIFGGGKSGAETQKADAVSQAANQLRYNQLNNLFNNQSYADYGVNRSDVFSLDANSQNLLGEFTSPDNLMSLQDYMNLGLSSGQNYMKQIASPELAQNYALQGMGESGANQEALAKAGAGVGMNFLQSIPGFMSAGTQSQQGLMNMSLLPQQLKQQDLLRQQGVVTTGLTGLPYTPQISKQTEEGSLPLFNLFGMGSSL